MFRSCFCRRLTWFAFLLKSITSCIRTICQHKFFMYQVGSSCGQDKKSKMCEDCLWKCPWQWVTQWKVSWRIIYSFINAYIFRLRGCLGQWWQSTQVSLILTVRIILLCVFSMEQLANTTTSIIAHKCINILCLFTIIVQNHYTWCSR